MFQVIRLRPERDDDVGCRLSVGVLLLKVADGTSRLLDIDGLFLGLNTTATQILLELLERSNEATVAALTERSLIDPQRIRQDIDELLETLARHGMLERADSRQLRKTILQWLSESFFLGIFWLIAKLPLSVDRKISILLPASYFSFRALGLSTAFSIVSSIPCRRSEVDPGRISAVRDRVKFAIQERAASGWFDISCKEKAFCAFFAASQMGLHVEVVLAADLYPFRTHCWCLSGDMILSDNSANCDTFSQIATLSRFPTQGTNAERF